MRNGKRIKEIDFNFWVWMFAGASGRFYATLKTGDTTYLLEGDVKSRLARVSMRTSSVPRFRPTAPASPTRNGSETGGDCTCSIWRR